MELTHIFVGLFFCSNDTPDIYHFSINRWVYLFFRMDADARYVGFDTMKGFKWHTSFPLSSNYVVFIVTSCHLHSIENGNVFYGSVWSYHSFFYGIGVIDKAIGMKNFMVMKGFHFFANENCLSSENSHINQNYSAVSTLLVSSVTAFPHCFSAPKKSSQFFKRWQFENHLLIRFFSRQKSFFTFL